MVGLGCLVLGGGGWFGCEFFLKGDRRRRNKTREKIAFIYI